ncbi:MAG: hypothetical protein ACXW2U_08945 [Telluria sp.]
MPFTPIPPLDRLAPTFRGDCDVLFASRLSVFTTEMNAFEAALTAMAAGGGFSMGYTFSTTTTDGDPTPGFLRLSSATQNLATVIRIDTTSGGADVTAVLDDMDSSSSLVKGQICLIKLGDVTKWLRFNLMSIASPPGYRNFTVVPVGGSAASPFANNDPIVLTFSRSGDIGVGTTYMKVSDRKADATTAGDSVATTISQTRTLNTVEHNSIAGASLAANQVTLPAGTYRYRARAPAYQVGFHRAFLYNVTDSTYIGLGSNAWAGTNTMSDSNVSGEFVLASSKVLALRHYTQAAGTGGLGGAGSSTGQSVVYAEIEFEKVV